MREAALATRASEFAHPPKAVFAYAKNAYAALGDVSRSVCTHFLAKTVYAECVRSFG